MAARLVKRRGGLGATATMAARRRALGAACASTGGVRRVRTRARSGGVSDAARQRGGSKAAAAAQRGSERTRAQVPARAHRAERRESAGKRERGEREREWREGEKVSGLTWFKLKIFNGNSKNFEHESCSKLNFPPLSF